MTKAEILAELNSNGQVRQFHRSPSWDKAFNLYNTTKNEKLNLRCGNCYRKVLAWLQS